MSPSLKTPKTKFRNNPVVFVWENSNGLREAIPLSSLIISTFKWAPRVNPIVVSMSKETRKRNHSHHTTTKYCSSLTSIVISMSKLRWEVVPVKPHPPRCSLAPPPVSTSIYYCKLTFHFHFLMASITVSSPFICTGIYYCKLTFHFFFLMSSFAAS